MFEIIFATVPILQGGVHLPYFGQSRRLFELRPEMTWPAFDVQPPAIVGVHIVLGTRTGRHARPGPRCRGAASAMNAGA